MFTLFPLVSRRERSNANLVENVVRVLSFVGGIDLVSEEFSEMVSAIDSRQPLSPEDWSSMSTYLNRLPLAPRLALFSSIILGVLRMTDCAALIRCSKPCLI